ncbi:MAG: class I SAM-dependent methyltransferase [Acidobacteria bacterium]|nr:class I SAM-dependent methyltransferase [Acidobacteriota bacterium]
MSAVLPAPRFGSGGAEPWAAALRGAVRSLLLVPTDPSAVSEHLALHRWTTAADPVDRAALTGLTGPLLDIGSGPGRMVRAAIEAGIEAYGLDADPAAVETSRATGIPVLAGSVFDALPDEGAWASLLLLDGNVGIGGDVAALLARCAELLRRGGVLVAEADSDPARDDVTDYRVRDSEGRESDVFPWSRVGLPALLRNAHDFALDRVWEQHGRWFAALRAL